MKRIWALEFFVIVLAGIGFIAYRHPALWHSWLGQNPPPQSIVVSGNIEAHESVLAFKNVQSRIAELPFDEGQSVPAGAVIARVDASDYRQQWTIATDAVTVQQRQLAAAQQNAVAAEMTVTSDQADLTMKQLDAGRAINLWAHGNGTTQNRDLAATAVRQAQAALERDKALASSAASAVDLARAYIVSAEAQQKMASLQVDDTVLSAPYSGVILVRTAELGEIVAPGTPVVTLADLDHVWLRAYINETDIARVRLGGMVSVTTDTYPGKVYPGRISSIASSAEFTPKSVETHAERITLVYRVKIDIMNPTHELVPGMPADAVIDTAAP